jgi:hypothetical protein
MDFLKENNLVDLEYGNTPNMNTIFDGFNRFEDNQSGKNLHGLIFYTNKFESDKQMIIKINMRPGLLSFKNNGYKTDEQIKEDRNFWLAIFIAILSPILTTILGFALKN